MKKKNTRIWIILLILPYVLLFLVIGMQFGARLANRNSCPATTQSSSSDGLSAGPGLQKYDASTDLKAVNDAADKCINNSGPVVLNLFSLLAGVVAVCLIMGLPLWVILLVRASSYNHKLSNLPPPAPTVPQPPVDPQPPQYPPSFN